jgi:hypothetical protein
VFFSFIKSLFSALSELFGFLKQNQLIQAGVDKVVAVQATKETEVVIQANKAREEVRVASASVPITDSLPDDGFRRD